ncbi:MAG: hypothetical protein IKA45_04180 [Bacteroidales bacterium]|nr:hypothetical protein [Bacteroidales bacterium]
MGESWITILIMVCFTLLPIIFDAKKKQRSAKSGEDASKLEELLSELELVIPEEEPEETDIVLEEYEKPEIKIRPTVVKPDPEKNVKKEVEVGRGMSKEDKRKLVIYSEVMSPKYKEY